MLETGVLLLFLVPGVAAYAAIYGLFHTGKTIAPEPPSANSIEAVVIIVGASIVVHAITSLLFTINLGVCSFGCPVRLPGTWLDPYGGAMRALAGGGIGGTALSLSLLGVVVQGAIIYGAVRGWLGRLARRDSLPNWIYGWAKPLADSLDNDDTLVVAYVLTTIDIAGKVVAYCGMLNDLAMKADGSVSRITLRECERYLVDLNGDAEHASLSVALSTFSFMVIETANIRNIAFETLIVDQEMASDTAG